MSGPPVISGRQAITALERIGYVQVRQRGSHVRLRHPSDSNRAPVTVPDHRQLKTGTLRAIIRDAGLSLEALLGRHVDLIERGFVQNPYVRASLERAKVPLYAAA